MELQWPLILFTTLTAWACGVFGAQGVLALKGAGKKSQQLLAVVSCVLLALGGIAVFFHLQHWERIFNGFGHITSGITQELIAIMVFVVVAVAYFVMARKSADGGTLPKWMAVLAIVISVVLAAVCAHSYMMPARPAWNSVLEVLSIVGAACLLGPATVAVALAAKGEDAAELGAPAVVGSAVGAVCTAVATSLLTAGQASYAAAGGADATLAFTQGSHWGFAFALALAVIGFACALRIKVKKRANVGTGEVAAADAAARAAAKASAATASTGDGTSPHDAAKSGARA